MFWGDWGKPTIPASAQLAAELPYAVSILIIAPCSHPHSHRQGRLAEQFCAVLCDMHTHMSSSYR